MEYYDLGRHSRPVTTSSPQAQTWFDRGLVWTYGFNHEEAVYCFEQALRHDPDCAMVHWGVGYALGPNYNKPWEAFDEADLSSTVPRAQTAVARALALAPSAAPAERALMAMRVHVLIRFGRWQEILDLPMPADPVLYCVTTAMLRYARGLACAALGRVAEAEAERQLFRLAQAAVPATRMLFNNTCADVLAIAGAMLDGELDYRKGNIEAAFAYHRAAAQAHRGPRRRADPELVLLPPRPVTDNGQRRIAAAQSVWSRSVRLSSLPPGLRGRGAVLTATYCGILKSAMCAPR
jgi:tetratricopeptide (TPR) repeat protein